MLQFNAISRVMKKRRDVAPQYPIMETKDRKSFTVTDIVAEVLGDDKKDIDFEMSDILPKPPFRTMIVAQSNSGKTNLIASMILKPYKTYFENSVVVFSKSLTVDRTWSCLPKSILTHCHEEFSDDVLKRLWDEQKREIEKKGKTRATSLLIVLDDMVSEIFSRGGKPRILDRLFMRGRHHNISLIVTSQKYSLVPLTVRTNCSDCIFFSLNNVNEQKAVYNEHGGPFTRKQWAKITLNAWNEQYGFLYIKYTDPNLMQRYRKNFGDHIQPE